MAYVDQTFSRSGPSYISAVDWSNINHKRSVLASLVQGVYTLQHDQRHNRKYPCALAHPWWDSFNFRVHDRLVDNKDGSIFGLVYSLISSPHQQTDGPPQYVIAFRGTIMKPENWEEDVKMNLKVFLNRIQKSNRFRTALEATTKFKHERVWLVGHSQGSSLALAVGREIVKKFKVRLETYLFNPPFISLPIERVKNSKVKAGLRFVSSFVTVGLTAAAVAVVSDASKKDHFAMLSTWVPYLFINRADPICSEYVGYFKNREAMEAIGVGAIVRVATKRSVLSMFSSSEPMHLLPSAHITLNVTAATRFKEAHGICKEWLKFKEAHGIDQWWRRDLKVECKQYQYK
ncbi:GDSL esterase/lipase At4g10955-like [Salvia hispanica]|uniref:GDSL esterase/lipase At4g10955-like n=1 Tax=Salvia hispanica TaxID=49212 RepID=UPI00200930F6|nr:GDSL esterase/lipase At4g10955-like [Salvia hispanica]